MAHPQLYDSTAAAEYLGLSRHTIRKYVQRGLITPHLTFGNLYVFDKKELDRYNKEKRPVGNPHGKRSK